MSVLTRLFAISISAGLPGSAGHVNAEINQLVSGHNDQEARIVVTEDLTTDPVTGHSKLISDLQDLTNNHETRIGLIEGSSIEIKDASFTLAETDAYKIVMQGMSGAVIITLPEPQLWDLGAVRSIIRDDYDVSHAVTISSSWWMADRGSIYLNCGQQVELTVVDDGASNYRWVPILLRDGGTMRTAAAGGTTGLTRFLDRIFIDESASAYQINLPAIDQDTFGIEFTVYSARTTGLVTVDAAGDDRIYRWTSWFVPGTSVGLTPPSAGDALIWKFIAVPLSSGVGSGYKWLYWISNAV